MTSLSSQQAVLHAGDTEENSAEDASNLRRSTRAVKRPTYLQGFQYNSLPTRSSTAHSISHHYSHDKLSSAHQSYVCNMTADQEPTTFAEASKHSQWQEAMQA